MLTSLLSTAEPAGDISRAAAGAREPSELAARLADAAGAFGPRPVIRIWRVRIGEVSEVGTSDGRRSKCPSHAILRATATTDPTRHGDCWLVPLLSGGVPIGVAEIHGGAQEVPAVVATASEALGGQLAVIWNGRSPRNIARMLGTESMAAQIQSVILTLSAQIQSSLPHDRLSIYLLTPDKMSLERFGVASWPPISGEMDVRPLEAVGLSRVIRTNQPIVSGNFGQDERILGAEDEIIARAGFNSVVSVPLRLVGSPFGILNFVSRSPRFYSEDDVPAAQRVADQIAAFLYELRLERVRRDELRSEAVHWERDRIAKELHDTLAQELAGIVVRAQRLQETTGDKGSRTRASQLVALAQEALERLRYSLFDAMPLELMGQTLQETLRTEVRRFERTTGISVTLELPAEECVLAPAIQAAILRVAQESLTNVARHSGASEVSVSLRVGSNAARLSVNDDGHGFNGEGAAGFGLRAMRRRAEEIGGQLIVVTQAGGPTAIHLAVPTGDDAVPDPSSMALSAKSPRPGCGEGIRVMIVDDHPLFADALRELISSEPDISVVGVACSGEEALSLAALLCPDVVILDLELPDLDGATVASRLRDLDQPPAVLMLSAFDHVEHVVGSLAAGARGFILKTAPRPALLESLRAACHGNVVLNASPWGDVGSDPPKLSARELEVLHLLAVGSSNREIAELLHLSPKTVERVVATIVTKLGARNRTHAAVLGLTRKLVDVRPLRALS